MKRFLSCLLLLSALFAQAQKVDNPRVVIRSCATCTDVLYRARAIVAKNTFPPTPEGRVALQAALLRGVYRLELANGGVVPAGTRPPRVPPTGTVTNPGSGTTTNPGSSTTTNPGSGTTTNPGSGTTTNPGSGTTTNPGTGTPTTGNFSQLIEAEAVTGQAATLYTFGDDAASGGTMRCCFSTSTDYLSYVVSGVPVTGSYPIELRYQTNMADEATGTIAANGVSKPILLAGLGGGKALVQVTLNLTAGTNTIRVAGGSGTFLQDRLLIGSASSTTTPPTTTTPTTGTLATAALANGSTGLQLILDPSTKSARVIGQMGSGSKFGVRLNRNGVEVGSQDYVSGPTFSVTFNDISGAGTYQVRCYEIGNDPNTLFSPELTSNQ